MLTLCCYYNVVTYSANASCASHGEVYSLHTASFLRGLNWYHMWLQLFQLFMLFTDKKYCQLLALPQLRCVTWTACAAMTHGWWLPCWLSIMVAALIWRCRIQGCFILKAQKCDIRRKRTFLWRKKKDAQTHSSPLSKLYPAEWSTWLLSEWLCVWGGSFPFLFSAALLLLELSQVLWAALYLKF